MSLFKFFKKMKLSRELDKALGDGVLTKDELLSLRDFTASLGLNEKDLDEIRLKELNKKVKPLLEKVNKTFRFSPDDEKSFRELSEAFQIKFDYQDDFKILRDLWEFDQYNKVKLQSILTDIMLKKEEECYFTADSLWKQLGTIRQSGKKLDVLKDISEGKFMVTNKRTLFVGDKKSVNVKLEKIMDVRMFNDATIEITKDSGKNDCFVLGTPYAEYARAVILSIKGE